MSLKKVELKFNDHTLMVDEHGNIYVKEIDEVCPVLSIDMYYCNEGRKVAETEQPDIVGKPAILLYGKESDDPMVIARYGESDTIIENYDEGQKK